jgi:SAM-dependent methyltransferase
MAMLSSAASLLVSRFSRRRSAVAPEATAAPPELPVGPDTPWWNLVPFTTHRIHLAGTMYTAEAGVDPAVDVRTHTVVEACGGSLAGRTIVDLGCLEGGFALEFARLGAERVVGIEARSVSVRRCELARDLLGLERAEFVQADIKDELPRHADGFDVVFAAGILYHLSDPAGFLQLVRASCRGVALIDTHVADPDTVTHDCSEQVVTQSAGGHDYQGRLFGEYEPGLDTVEREGLLWAAWSDAASFWPFEDDLVRMLHDAGFSDVEKIERDTMRHPWQVDAVNRVLYVCRV